MRSGIRAFITVALLPVLAPAVEAQSHSDTTWVVTFDHDFYNWADAHVRTFQLPPDSLMWEIRTATGPMSYTRLTTQGWSWAHPLAWERSISPA